MKFLPYTSRVERIWYYTLRGFCCLVFFFLVGPILAVIPLSFNSSTFLTYPMSGVSLRWYRDFFHSPQWLPAFKNSLLIGSVTTVLSTSLGTLAALGLARIGSTAGWLIAAFVISPRIVPVVITAVGVYFLYAPLGLTNNYLGLILAHSVLAVPFVVITVTATLQGFDFNLVRAGASLGASPAFVFRRVILPLILPGVLSGAAFAFATSFDEIVVALFVAGPMQRTIPIQMWNGVREEISPTITAAATVLVVISVSLLVVVELLRRRGERLRGGVA